MTTYVIEINNSTIDTNPNLDKDISLTSTLQRSGGDGDDFLFGTADKDTIFGEGGNDEIYGNGSDDILYGDDFGDLKTGSDRISGGEGDDIILGGKGLDLLYGDNGLDVILGGDGNDYLFGGAGADRLEGGLGDDYLDGGAGDEDEFLGSFGNDIYVIDFSADQIFAEGSEPEWGIDKISASINYTLGENIEDLTLTGNAFIGLGNNLNNVIRGNSNNSNHLEGLDGDDTLYGSYAGGGDLLIGGSGKDRMVGYGGNDLYLVDNIGDIAIESAGEGYDTVSSSVSYTLGANIEQLELFGTGNGVGNSLDNIITGSLENNRLYGGAGNDSLSGGYGNDGLFGDEGLDSIYGGEGSDAMYGGMGNDLLYGEAGTDNIRGDNDNDILYGGNDNDNLYGDNGLDILNGDFGNDTLQGGLGNDSLLGGDGNDILIGSGGGVNENDTFSGGMGTDRFYLGYAGVRFYTDAGFASIADFNRGEADKIYLAGSSAGYSLQSISGYGGSASDTGIYYQSNLVGVAWDVTLALTTDFTFV